MSCNYEELYRKQKEEYIIFKSMLFEDHCLTIESNNLLNGLHKLKLEYFKLFDEITPKFKFNENTCELIKVIKNGCDIDNYIYKKKTINTSFGKFIREIDTNELEKYEKVSPRRVGEYLRGIKNNIKRDNLVDKQVADLEMWFIGSDVVNELKFIKGLDIFNKYTVGDINILIPQVMIKMKEDRFINEIMFHIKVIKNFIKYLTKKDISMNPDFIIIPSNAKKVFSDNGEVISPKSINSAEYNPRLNLLHIYRREELSKLLFHELIHQSEYDNKLYSNESFIDLWAIDKERLYLNEMITETIAQFINTVVTSCLCGKDFIKMYNSMWMYEILFGLVQTAKILSLSGFKSISELYTKPFIRYIKTTTNTFEYHILKTICMININDVLFYYKNNNIGKLLEIIHEYAKNSEYNAIVNKFMGHRFQDHFLGNTGRMSAIERHII